MDELNAIVGIVRTLNEERLADGQHHRWLDDVLKKIQNQLFDLGSELATPPGAEYEGMFRFTESEVKGLEDLMDQCQKDLEPLKSFTLPGGGRINAFLHHARTVCRRFERDLWRLSREEAVNEWDLKYVNRLSDTFFVLGRWVAKRLGEKEYLWERGLSAHQRRRAPSSGRRSSG
jgi:cob(I)alamin adenosyltransferase